MDFFWLGALIASFIVLVSGTALLGTALARLVGLLCSSFWTRVLIATCGFILGAVLGGIYWLENVEPMRGANEVAVGEAIWHASWPIGLVTGITGLFLLVLVSTLHRQQENQKAAKAAKAVPLDSGNEKICYLCGQPLLTGGEVDSRVCRQCKP